MPRRKAPVIPADLLDQLLAGGDVATALNSGGLLDALKKAVATALKNFYRAIDAEAAEEGKPPGAFETGVRGQKYPAIGQIWRRVWQEVIPFFAFPGDVRRIIFTTNAIEALNSRLRRAVRARGHFPNDEAAVKLLFLILNRSEKEWTMPPREWAMAKAPRRSSSPSVSTRYCHWMTVSTLCRQRSRT
jgi:transposase-like protein